MDDRNFFDRLAPTWDDNEVKSTPEKVRRILDLMEIKTGDKVLDLGTGTGVLLPHIAAKIGPSGEITAVDYSSGMLERAKEKFRNLSPQPLFLNLDFENENIAGEFDKIILYCVYPHLHTPVDTLKWLRKVNLKAGGDIFIAFPCSEEFINNIHKEKKSESDKLMPPHALAEFLKGYGLEAEVVAASEEYYIVKIS